MADREEQEGAPDGAGTPPPRAEHAERSDAEPEVGGTEAQSDVQSSDWKERWRPSKRLGVIAGVSVLVIAALMLLVWERCGIAGCPDVDMLRGYMPDEASVVLDRNGDEVAKLFVERRVVIGYDSLPEHVGNAFVAIEDRRFWDHGGVDWRRVIGAGLKNVKSGGVEEGASTITMQLARNVYPDAFPASEKTLTRKLGEARIAREIESRYSKEEILELYLNQIYFGEGAYGIEAASQEYYGKSATELTLPEAATLAALPRAPSRLNPRANADAAQEGREAVLERMAAQGMITEAERSAAAEEELRLRRGDRDIDEVAPYFVEAVRRRLEEQLGDAIYTRGYRIHTTLDLGAQKALEEELARQARAIESGQFGGYPHDTYAGVHGDSTTVLADGTPYLQTAGVFMEAQTGNVIALVGGRSYDDSKFNRATQAQRQPGSAFKPVVYATALSSGYSPSYQLIDRPISLAIDNNRTWEPTNYDGSYSGVVTLREALVHSKNVPTVRLAGEVGLGRVVGMAEQLGFGRVPSNPAVVLGTFEVTPTQLASAFSTFATLGQRSAPRFVLRVVDRDGQVVYAEEPSVQRVLDPAVAFLTTNILQDVVNRGTGAGVRGVGFRGAAAGKTGTTQDAADVWFVGYTPNIVGVVWYGMDKRQRILRGATGGEIAAPVWGRVMRRLGATSEGWQAPSGVEMRQVDGAGTVLGSGCPVTGAVREEYFLSGTAPLGECYRDPYTYQTAFGDSLGYEPYDFPMDSTTSTGGDAGWWDRLRSRVLGAEGDSVRVRPAPAIAIDSAAAQRRRESERSDPRVLGTPVNTPAPPTPTPTPREPERRADPDPTPQREPIPAPRDTIRLRPAPPPPTDTIPRTR